MQPVATQTTFVTDTERLITLLQPAVRVSAQTLTRIGGTMASIRGER